MFVVLDRDFEITIYVYAVESSAVETQITDILRKASLPSFLVEVLSMPLKI